VKAPERIVGIIRGHNTQGTPIQVVATLKMSGNINAVDAERKYK